MHGICRQAQLVKMMGNVEGMEQHVRTWENQAYDLSKGIEVCEIKWRGVPLSGCCRGLNNVAQHAA